MTSGADKAGSRSQRRYDLDWLRVILVFMVIQYHISLIFVGGWYIDPGPSFHIPGLNTVLAIGSFWRMPILFFVAGAGTWFALRRISATGFLRERVRRLLVPLAFGILIVIPPQHYFARNSQIDFGAALVEYYRSLFAGAYDNWAHLWFIAYLFLFTVVALPIFLFVRSERGQRAIGRIVSFVFSGPQLLLLAVPLVATEVALRARWPGSINVVDDWTNVVLFFTLFVYGFVLTSQQTFWSAVERWRTRALGLGIATSLTMIVFGWMIMWYPFDYSSPGYVPHTILRALNGYFWLIAILGFSMKYLNFENRLLRYTRDASYPFYVLHGPIVVIAAYYIVQTPFGPYVRFPLLTMICVGLILAAYELLVRRNNVTRVVFGMKPIVRPSPRPASSRRLARQPEELVAAQAADQGGSSQAPNV